jgi:hypothetical protein
VRIIEGEKTIDIWSGNRKEVEEQRDQIKKKLAASL